MTMRVSLIIDGDPKGAKAAVAATEADLNRLGKTAADTQAKLNTVKPPVQPVRDFGNEVKLSGQDLTNLQFQLNDMAVGLASGQSPFTVAMQQGMQMSQMFRSGTGVMGALRAVGGGVVSFITNPLNLAVLGFGLAATAATSFFSAVMSDGGKGNAILEQHDALIKRIGESWDESARRMKKYATDTNATLLSSAMLNVQQQESEARRQMTLLSRTTLYLPSSGNTAVDSQIAALERRFKEALGQGTGDVKAFLDEISKIAIANGSEGALKLKDELAKAYDPLLQLQNDLSVSRDVVKGLQGDHSLLNQALGKSSDAVTTLTGKLNGLSNGAAFAAAQQGFGGVAGAPVSSLVGKSLLDLIGATEGTDKGRGYNETLAYGKFTGGPVDLVTMKLSEILDLQKRMLADPSNTFNSSAVGRYQITSETLRDFMPRLGLDGNTIFSPAVQDRIALAIANAAGRDVDKLRGRWASFKTIDEGVIKRAFDGASVDRSGVAGSMATAEKKDRTAELKEQEAAKKRLLDMDSRWASIIANATAQETQRSDAVGKTAGEQARLRVEQQLWQQARSTFGERLEKDKKLYGEVAAEIRKVADASAGAAQKQDLWKTAREAAAESERDQIRRMDEMRGTFGGMASTFVQAKQQGQGWGGALNTVLDSIANKLGNVADKMIDSLLFGKQGTSGGGLLGGFFASLLPFAKGATFAGGITAFAAGASFTNSIVDQPTFFRYGGKQLGVMGEAGEEAIMPLKGGKVLAMTGKGQGSLPLMRMGDGSLGVDMRGPKPFALGGTFGGRSGFAGAGSGGSGEPTVNLSVHNYGSDKVEAKATKGQNGALNLDVAVGQMVNQHIAKGGADQALGQRFAVNKRVERHGS